MPILAFHLSHSLLYPSRPLYSTAVAPFLFQHDSSESSLFHFFLASCHELANRGRSTYEMKREL